MPTYRMTCDNCGETQELVVGEYLGSDARGVEVGHSCGCGNDSWNRKGPELVAKFDRQWGFAAHGNDLDCRPGTELHEVLYGEGKPVRE